MGAMESQGNANEWFRALLGNLSEDHAKKIKEIITLCDQRKAAKESKSIEQAGGEQLGVEYSGLLMGVMGILTV